jgi:hypothetical protein
VVDASARIEPAYAGVWVKQAVSYQLSAVSKHAKQCTEKLIAES